MSAFAMSLGSGEVASIFLVLLRCTGFVMTAPILGHRTVPRPVKAGLGMLLAITLAGRAAVADGAAPVMLAAPVELLIGLALGYAMALGFAAIETASRLLSIQMGFSLGAVFDPVGGEASTALSPLFMIMSGLLFLGMNLHLVAIGILADSFTLLPIGGGWPAGLLQATVNLVTLSLGLAARVAMPIALVLLLTELSVALISRAIPQINVFFLGLPLMILVGVGLIALSLPALLDGTARIFRFLIDGASAALTAGVLPVATGSPLPSLVP